MKKYRCVKEIHITSYGPLDLYHIEEYIGWKYLGYWQYVSSTTSAYENIAWQKLDIELARKKKSEVVSSKQL